MMGLIVKDESYKTMRPFTAFRVTVSIIKKNINFNSIKGTLYMYYVYIMTNKYRTVLYTGVTGNIEKRIYEHKNKTVEGFTSKYNADKVVYIEGFENVVDAINAEKTIKGWRRSKKIAIIEEKNPNWNDLSIE